MKRILKIALILVIPVLTTACKLAVIAVEGGEVQSNASGTCIARAICIIEVTDPEFAETFTAVADNGWSFVQWNSGHRFFCGDSTDPDCTLSFAGHEDPEAVQDMVDSAETFYLMPIFKMVEDIPGKDTVLADGKEWAQVDLFTGLSWIDISAVCSVDNGVCSGVLNGYNMTGWTWASLDNVNALFNFYIGAEVLGPGPDDYHDSADSKWATAFFNQWRATGGTGFQMLGGSMRTVAEEGKAYAAAAFNDVDTGGVPGSEPGDMVVTFLERDVLDRSASDGAWFYRQRQ